MTETERAVLKAERETLLMLGLAHKCSSCRGVGQRPGSYVISTNPPPWKPCARCSGTGLVETGQEDSVRAAFEQLAVTQAVVT